MQVVNVPFAEGSLLRGKNFIPEVKCRETIKTFRILPSDVKELYRPFAQ